uniref:Uncharacterized protein n=1 Tax=Moniliophthora roreri TaxID=221103 RepID=A0A0W0FE21_MONRR
MRLYNHTRKALIALGMDIHVIGESTPDSWYWNTSTQSGSSEREEVVWRLELNRVKWFCDHTCLDRYCEEIEILEAEFTHAASDDQEPGYAAYACKQAATYQILLDDVEQTGKDHGNTDQSEDALNADGDCDEEGWLDLENYAQGSFEDKEDFTS